MLLLIEAIFIHGFLAFSTMFQYAFELNCFITHNENQPTVVQKESIGEVLSVAGVSVKPVVVRAIPKAIPEPVTVKAAVYVESTLSEKHLQFFEEIASSVQKLPTVSNPVFEMESINEQLTFSQSNPDAFPEITEDISETTDMLTMDQWKKEPETIEVAEILTSTATAKISDYQLGEQVWVVEVKGKEQDYLHVSDGSGRAWINSEKFGLFDRRDIVSIHVNRKSDLLVELLDAVMLQEHSREFSIVDDLDVSEYVDNLEIIGA